MQTMVGLLISLGTLLSGAAGTQRPHTAPTAAATVHLRIDQDAGLSPKDIGRVVDELRNIWKAAGIRVTSGRYHDAVPSGRAIVSLRFVRLTHPPVQGRAVLAWVSAGDFGSSTPNLFVSLTTLTQFLAAENFRGRRLADRPRALREQLIARAAGRVAAHELGHYLLQTRSHDREGLMRPVYVARDLLGDSLRPFAVPSHQEVALRREVERLAASPPQDRQLR